MWVGGRDFREVWAADFEFSAPSGERPKPICMVARELGSGRTMRLWQDELELLSTAPYATSSDCLFSAYYASAEVGCHLALGWPVPSNILDLFTEFRNSTNGKPIPCGNGLIGALTYYGLDSVGAIEKDSMRELALRGGPYTDSERRALLGYCESDVVALGKLLPCMMPALDLPRALLRGRYMAAAARREHLGIPIDVHTLETLRTAWNGIQDGLIQRIDRDYGVFDGRTFKAGRFASWLVTKGIPWPQLPSGALALDGDTFREMARCHPAVAPIRELRVSLSQMRLGDLAVGSDGRNRCILSAFRSKTGRNQPSNARFIFGPAVWLRSLIRPEPGFGLAYIDWSQQEFGIGAALSDDAAMMAAYESGDPYLAFAKQAGAVPVDATKQMYGPIREQFKACALGLQYGMAEQSLAQRIGRPVAQARELIRRHRETFRTFWRWSDAAVDRAMLQGQLHATFGWTIRVGSNVNSRSLRNFPLQANGAEMLHFACIFAVERGIRVCAPVHDAILIEAPLDQLDDAVRETQRAMGDASELVLSGFRLRSDVRLIQYPDRFIDKRGQRMWRVIQDILAELSGGESVASTRFSPSLIRDTTVASTPPLYSLISCMSMSYENNNGPSRPETIGIVARTNTVAETVKATTKTQNPRKVSQGSDPLALDSSCGKDGGSDKGASCSDCRMVLGRRKPKSDSTVASCDPSDFGHRKRRSVSRADKVGESEVSIGEPTAQSRTVCDDLGLPEWVTDSDPAPRIADAPGEWADSWRELYEERAAIRFFDGEQVLELAETEALREIVAWRRAEGVEA